MILLLLILTAGLLVGRLATRITPAVDLALFAIIAVLVMAQLLLWQSGLVLDLGTLLHGAGGGGR